MTSEPLLLVAWLLLAHLVGDFVLQTEGVATRKFGDGPAAWTALLAHVAVVATVALPSVLIFGVPGLGYVALTAVTHLLIDRTKIVLTRRLEERALQVGAPVGAPDAEGEDPTGGPASVMGSSWSLKPGILFLGDQAAHVVVLLAGGLVLFGPAPVTPGIGEAVASIADRMGPSDFHQRVLGFVVVASLLVVNVRAASLFISVLVRPPGHRSHEPPVRETLGAEGESPAQPETSERRPSAWTVRLGPLVGRVEPDPRARAPAALPAERPVPQASLQRGSQARVGAAIGILERLLVVVLVLAGGVATVGLVVAAKTLARFKQLDDREFAEYYLLGTLASVTIAVATSLLAQAVLAS